MKKTLQIYFLIFIKFLILFTLLIWSPSFAEANGGSVFKKCISCHNFKKNKLGPHLIGIIGRKAGFVKNYRYSKAMKQAGESGLIWTESNLDKFLTKPKTFMKRTKMSFAGIRQKAQRKALIKYLREK